MAEISYPFENADTSEAQFSALFSELQDTGVAGEPGAASTLAVTTTSGLGLQVAAGFAIVRGFAYDNTSALSLTVGTAAAQPRIDTIILRLDPSANSIVAAVKAGTPGASPSAPALTQTPGAVWEMPLADILVPASASALIPGNLTDRRRFTGGRVGLWSTNTRPTSPRVSRLGYNTSVSRFEFWNGTTWADVSPSSLDASVITSGTLDIDRIPSITKVDGKRIVVSETEPTAPGGGWSIGDVWIDY